MGLTDPLKEKQGWRIVTAAAVAGTVGIGGLIFAGQDGGGEALAGPISLQDRIPVTSEVERATPYTIVGGKVNLVGADSASDSPFDDVLNFGSASATADSNDSPDGGVAQSGALASDDSPDGVRSAPQPARSSAPAPSETAYSDDSPDAAPQPVRSSAPAPSRAAYSDDSPDVAPQPARSSAPAPSYVNNSVDSVSFDSPS